RHHASAGRGVPVRTGRSEGGAGPDVASRRSPARRRQAPRGDASRFRPGEAPARGARSRGVDDRRSRMIVRTESAVATRAVGAAIASCVAPGDVVVLSGDLGSGKTTLAQGIAAALGVTEPVVSPTYAIVREYVG